MLNPPPKAPSSSWVDFGSQLCQVCAYDDKGTRTLRGQFWGIAFSGETTEPVLDATGKMEVVKNEKGEIVQRIALGPFGMTEQRMYLGGALQQRNAFKYDQNGQLVESSSFDSLGTLNGCSVFRRDESGRMVEFWNFGPMGAFLSHSTDVIDPDTGAETLTQFNQDMTAKNIFTLADGKVASYWQEDTAVSSYGNGIRFDSGPTQLIYEWHYPNGTFVKTTLEFVDDSRRDPIHEEFRDEHDQIQLRADYDYEFDSYHNWIKRTIWAWTPQRGVKKLIRIDKRTIEYWQSGRSGESAVTDAPPR